jgi:hypothetical protein
MGLLSGVDASARYEVVLDLRLAPALNVRIGLALGAQNPADALGRGGSNVVARSRRRTANTGGGAADERRQLHRTLVWPLSGRFSVRSGRG